MKNRGARLKVLFAGVFSLILTLGVARFSYTPLLPIMQKQAGLGIAEGSWLAAVNYLGYLCGAIIVSLISDLHLKDRLYRIGLLSAVVTTVWMGLTDDLWLWLFLRFLSGLSSAAGMLLGSGLVLNWLLRNDHRGELGIHLSGIGLGIAFSAVAVEVMNSFFNWSEQWQLLGFIGFFMLVPAWLWLPKPEVAGYTRNGGALVDNPPGKLFMLVLILAYFCAGVGFVVSATFIVAVVEKLPGLEGRGNMAFTLIGLAAAPACFIWDLIARRVGYLNSLLLAYILQICSILMPVVTTGFIATMFGALLFGGTFVGIVSLVLVMAGLYYPARPAKMMGKMTISYGVAQIAAPAVIGFIARVSGNYNTGFYLAAFTMLIGTFTVLALKIMERREANLYKV